MGLGRTLKTQLLGKEGKEADSAEEGIQVRCRSKASPAWPSGELWSQKTLQVVKH